MDKNDYALIISLVSLTTAIAGFVWNVWSKFIYPKAKVQVGVSVMSVYNADGSWGPESTTLSATNFGPGEVTLYCAIASKAKFKKSEMAMLNPYKAFPYDLSGNGPFNGVLPKKLAVGEQFSVHFPVVRDWFEIEKLKKFGFQDTFGRNHWSSRDQVKKLEKDVLKKTSQNNPGKSAGEKTRAG